MPLFSLKLIYENTANIYNVCQIEDFEWIYSEFLNSDSILLLSSVWNLAKPSVSKSSILGIRVTEQCGVQPCVTVRRNWRKHKTTVTCICCPCVQKDRIQWKKPSRHLDLFNSIYSDCLPLVIARVLPAKVEELFCSLSRGVYSA